MSATRAFVLHRDRDITGVSGTGPVADGVEFPDGTAVVRWRDLDGPADGVVPTTVVFPSVEAVEALHGHAGATRLVWGAATATCKHCARVVTAALVTVTGAALPGSWVHAEGGQRGLHRCHTEDSGLPYGHDAAPVGEPCGAGCLGQEDA